MITKATSLEGETDYVSPFVMKYAKIKSKGHLYSQLANLTEHIKTIVLKMYEYAESHKIIDRYDSAVICRFSDVQNFGYLTITDIMTQNQ